MERSNKRKRRKIKRNKERRRAQKKLQRGRREQRETEKWTKIFSTAVEVEKTLQEKRPLDRTGVDWTLAQLKLLAKRQKFVPSPHKVDRVSKYKDFMAFARKLQLALYFSRIKEENGEEDMGTSFDIDKMPWEKPSIFDPPPGQNDTSEEFLTSVFEYVFNPKNTKKFVDNLTREERMALRDMSHWNGDKSNPKVIRLQDKESCFVIDYKQKYVENHLRYIGDERTFGIDTDDLSQQTLHKVRNWVRK